MPTQSITRPPVMPSSSSRQYHLNQAAFFTSLALEISRLSDPGRKDEVEQYKRLAKGEMEESRRGDQEIPCPF